MKIEIPLALCHFREMFIGCTDAHLILNKIIFMPNLINMIVMLYSCIDKSINPLVHIKRMYERFSVL
jgi:hypothetical protein